MRAQKMGATVVGLLAISFISINSLGLFSSWLGLVCMPWLEPFQFIPLVPMLDFLLQDCLPPHEYQAGTHHTHEYANKKSKLGVSLHTCFMFLFCIYRCHAFGCMFDLESFRLCNALSQH